MQWQRQWSVSVAEIDTANIEQKTKRQREQNVRTERKSPTSINFNCMMFGIDGGVFLPHVPLVHVLLQQSALAVQLFPSSEQDSSDLEFTQSVHAACVDTQYTGHSMRNSKSDPGWTWSRMGVFKTNFGTPTPE